MLLAQVRPAVMPEGYARLMLMSFVYHDMCLGEEVTFYFAWMNFFTLTLLVPGLLGFGIFLTRPKGMDVDHAHMLPIFAMVVTAWAVLFLIVSIRVMRTRVQYT